MRTLLAGIAGCWFMMAGAVWGGTGATLEWDANTEPDVRGYKLYYGLESGNYSCSVDAGAVTETNVAELVAGYTYYFAVTAYNEAGLESAPSNEVVFTVPVPVSLEFASLPAARVPIPTEGEPGGCLVTPVPSATGFGITITAAVSTAITVYTSEDMINWDIEGVLPNPTGRMTIRDRESAGRPRRFYRMSSAALPEPPG